MLHFNKNIKTFKKSEFRVADKTGLGCMDLITHLSIYPAADGECGSLRSIIEPVMLILEFHLSNGTKMWTIAETDHAEQDSQSRARFFNLGSIECF